MNSGPDEEDGELLRAAALETARSVLVLRARADKKLARAKEALEARTAELAVANAKLQESLDELNRTHWHLRKIAEVLPMCAECGNVKPGDGEWQTVVDYLRENSLFLSHGCCPDCAGKLLSDLQLAREP